MDLANYFSQHHDQLFYLAGCIGLIVELTVMGMSGPLLFFSIASFITGGLISAGIVSDWTTEILTFGVISAVVTAILWKPLRSIQNKGDGSDTSSDMIGQAVPCAETVTPNGGAIRHSGINWMARLSSHAEVEKIEAGERCVITAVEGNVMIVDEIK